MTTFSRLRVPAFALLFMLWCSSCLASALVPGDTSSTLILRAQASPGQSTTLRQDNESKKCKKAKRAYAITKRNRYAKPLDINKDRRAMLAACR